MQMKECSGTSHPVLFSVKNTILTSSLGAKYLKNLLYMIKKCLIGVLLIYSIVFLVYSKVIQLHIYIFQIIFPYNLVQDVKCSFLCYAINPHCWSILYVVVCVLLIPYSLFIPLLPSHLW